MEVEFISKLALWILLWAIGFGIFFFYLNKRRITYTENYITTSVYFLFLALAATLLFKEELKLLFAPFEVMPFALLIVTFILNGLAYYAANKFLTKPTLATRRNSTQYFFRRDFRYLVSKSFEILFQQVLIAVLILMLKEQGFSLDQIILIFSLLFCIVHLPLLKTAGVGFGVFYIFSSIVSAFIFPYLVLEVNHGFIYSYTVHWVFYILAGLSFWCYYEKNKTRALFLLLIVLQALHVLEEVWGGAYFIYAIYGGIEIFLLIMTLLFLPPLLLFYFVYQKKRWAYSLSFVYAGILILDGLDHIIELILLRAYFHGAAGLYTGILLMMTGVVFIYSLWKDQSGKKFRQQDSKKDTILG